MEMLIPTNKERQRMNRDQSIADYFRSLRKAYPGAPAARIIRTIASSGKFSLSEPAIKQILYRTGTIVPNRKNA